MPGDDSNFATQLFAKSPGQVTVKVSVKAQRNSQIYKQAVLTDELQIQVCCLWKSQVYKQAVLTDELN